MARGVAKYSDFGPTDMKFYYQGCCYFPSVWTEIKCNYSLFSVPTDGNLYAYIRYFPSIWTENSELLHCKSTVIIRYLPSVRMEIYS